VWGEEWKHDWPTWRALLPHYFETRFWFQSLLTQ
jgi:hypothetical protein